MTPTTHHDASKDTKEHEGKFETQAPEKPKVSTDDLLKHIVDKYFGPSAYSDAVAEVETRKQK